ncbi:MAG: hypothetical protein K6E72_01320 [Saccharofermentans sp.]|nr:hypothetical protein [Saccharofermentans sp.]
MSKKINAVLGLILVTAFLIHIIYEIYAYLTFYYNPVFTRAIADSAMSIAVLHMLFSAFIVFISHDKGMGMRYFKLNIRTLLQRISAIAIVVLLFPHLKTFSLLKESYGTNMFLFASVMTAQILFYAAILFHISVSTTNAFITLGIMSSEKARKRLDVTVSTICILLFIAASFVIVRSQLIMLSPSFAGGTV